MPNSKGEKSVYTDKISMSGRSANILVVCVCVMIFINSKNGIEVSANSKRKKKEKNAKENEHYSNYRKLAKQNDKYTHATISLNV